MKIKLTPEQVDEIVREDLTSALEYSLKPESDPYETFDNRANLIKALTISLTHYTKPSGHLRVYQKYSSGLCDLQDYYEQVEEE